MNRRPATSLIADVTNQIRDQLSSYGGNFLPSISQLCNTYRASRPTIGAALAHLQSEGLLKLHGGRRAEIIGHASPAELVTPTVTSENQVYLSITKLIADSTFPAGSLMPKGTVIGKEMGVSSRTMARVMSRLVREGIIHRKGRNYVVGARTELISCSTIASPSLLVIISYHPSHWEGLRNSPRTRPFIEAFIAETNRYNVRLVNVVGADVGRLPYSPQLPEGIEGLKKVVLDSQGRYIGALIVASSDNPPGLNMWRTCLQTFRHPVVWFDRIDERRLTIPRSSLFTRCSHNESGMAQASVQFLHAHGHRKAIYPYNDSDWSKNRGEELCTFGSKMSPPLQITCVWRNDPRLWENPGQSGLVDSLDSMAARTPVVRDALAAFDRLWPEKREAFGIDSLQEFTKPDRFRAIFEYSYATRCRKAPQDPLLDEHAGPIWTALEISDVFKPGGATALIAPHDGYAYVVLTWAHRCGYSIPKDFSVISFDNRFSSSLLRMTSVDPGFAELGYQAFHAILRVVPTRRDRAGTIYTRPKVVDGGLVAHIGN